MGSLPGYDEWKMQGPPETYHCKNWTGDSNGCDFGKDLTCESCCQNDDCTISAEPYAPDHCEDCCEHDDDEAA